MKTDGGLTRLSGVWREWGKIQRREHGAWSMKRVDIYLFERFKAPVPVREARGMALGLAVHVLAASASVNF